MTLPTKLSLKFPLEFSILYEKVESILLDEGFRYRDYLLKQFVEQRIIQVKKNPYTLKKITEAGGVSWEALRAWGMAYHRDFEDERTKSQRFIKERI